MTSYDDLNSFIENYLKNDKSQRALMLTAPWGTGKSYYIKNSLCPFLHSNKLNYAVVSLYGIHDLKEVNKELFLEIKLQRVPKKYRWLSSFGKTLASGTAIVGKTILKQLANVDIDLSVKEPNYEKIYESINLKNRLIIFEDLERASVDIVEFLGYVNNLVEQDGIKVLIVANEDEIIKTNENDANGKKVQECTTKSAKYLNIKEKTVGDTIHFTSNIIESITSIISSFDSPIFNKLLEEKDPNGDVSFSRRVKQQLDILKCSNFRSVLYACQKMDDVLNREQKEFDLKFVENLFIGTICYSVKANNGGSRTWDSQSFMSQNLGTYAYPLQRAMYDYIENHIYKYDDFKEMESLYLKASEIGAADEELKVLYNYYVFSEKKLRSTIDFIEKNLVEDKRIVHDEYARIANYLISVKYEVNFKDETNDKIDKCLSLMLENVKNSISNGQRVSTYIKHGIELKNKEQGLELEKFVNKIEEYQKNLNKAVQGFTYKPHDISEYYDYLIKNNIKFTDGNGFLNKFDSSKLIDMLTKASASEIEAFRGVIQLVYCSFSNIKDFFKCDLLALKEFVTQLDNIFGKEGIDKIQQLQFRWLEDNLKDIINKLEN